MSNINLSLYFLCILLINLGFQVEMAKGIVGGSQVEAGEHKAIVSIWTNGRYVCSGAMISDKHALAAAHCAVGENNLFKNSEFTIRAGTNNFYQPSVTATVDTVYIPRTYFRAMIVPEIGFNNELADICVFRLSQGFNLRREVRKLKLPPHMNNQFQTYHGVPAKVLGFGATTNGIRIGRDGENSENCRNYCGKLKILQTSTTSRADCINQYGLLEYKHICAKANSPDAGTCFGDAGGPLIVNEDTIIAVLAQNTARCNERSHASIYTRVSNYMFLIVQAVQDTDNQLGDEIFDNIRVADWICRQGSCSMIERT